MTDFKFRFVVNTEYSKIELPVVMSSIRGEIEPDRFVMIGSRLTSSQQNRILDELIQAFLAQIKNGWKPKFVSYLILIDFYLLRFVDDRFYSVLGLVLIMINIQVGKNLQNDQSNKNNSF